MTNYENGTKNGTGAEPDLYMNEVEFDTLIRNVRKDAIEEYRSKNPIRRFVMFSVEMIIFLVIGTLGVSGLLAAGWVFGLALKLLMGK